MRRGVVLGGMSGSVVASLWLAGSPVAATEAEEPDIPSVPSIPDRPGFVQAVCTRGVMVGILIALRNMRKRRGFDAR
jgi:hypothetical protein